MLTGDGETMVVQCKAQQTRVSTGILRRTHTSKNNQKGTLRERACATTSDFAVKARQYAVAEQIYTCSRQDELADVRRKRQVRIWHILRETW